MLRVLHVSPTYYPATRYGGPIRSIHGLCVALARRGHDVHVFTTSVDGNDDLDVPLGSVDLDGVRVHYFRVPPVLRRLFWSPAMADSLRREVQRFDVVHLHSVFLWPTWAAARAAQRARVPYLMCPRGMLMREVIRRKNQLVKRAWINMVERRSLAHSSGVHVTADLEAEEMRLLGLPAPKVFCLPNGVARPTQPVPLSAGPFADVRQPYALFLSRISWKKGLDRLVRAWQNVPALDLVVVGTDDEGYWPQVERLAKSLGVHERVRFLGAASDDHKWALYQHAEMFLLPSYSENFGNVVAEAMAMACPVIVTEEVGIAPLVRGSGAGLITSGEPQQLAELINELHADPARRRAMGGRGAHAVAEHLSIDAVAASMEQIYEGVLASGDDLLRPASARSTP